MLKILVRPAAEIAIKSPVVQREWINKLVDNMKFALEHYGIESAITVKQLRLYVDTNSDAAAEVLRRVFGISSLSIIEHICTADLEIMHELAVSNYAEKVRSKTFRIRAKRSNFSGFGSKDAEIKIGGALAPFSGGVKLKNPEVEIFVDIKEDKAYFYSEKKHGAEGIPLGVQGKVLCLMSGGMDSPVAAWNLMKRGVDVDYLFCNLAAEAYERSVIGVTKHLVDNWAFHKGHKPKFYSVDFSNIVSEIQTKMKKSYSQVLLKRSMYKVAEIIAQKTEAECLITGESIGQVSSQTISNLGACEDAVDIPVLRPVVCVDKNDIVRCATKIGSFEYSKHIQEYCHISKGGAPIKAANKRYCRELEELFSEGLRENACDQVKTYDLRNLDSSSLVTDLLFKSRVPTGAVVVDCRPKKHFEHWHYPGATRMDLPELMEQLSNFSKDKIYIFCCQWGTQTAVAAEKYQKHGYEAYSFKGGSDALYRYAQNQGQQ